VQTRMRLVAAPTRACTGRRLTFQRRVADVISKLRLFAAEFAYLGHNCLGSFQN
jgi:hypothetical protein